MKTITFDEKSVQAVSAGQFDLDSLYATLTLPSSDETAKCVLVGHHGYVLSRSFQHTDALLTVSLEPDGPLASLTQQAREEALGRLMKCATMMVTGRTRSIPDSWRAWHQKNRLSFQADRRFRSGEGGRTDAGRILVDLSTDLGQRLFAFRLDRSGVQDLSLFTPPVDLQSSALGGVLEAMRQSESQTMLSGLGNQVRLDASLPVKIQAQMTVDEWFDSRLTAAQRRFVEHPLTSGVKLVGPAGTGKTIALVVKCLRDLDRANGERAGLNGAKRFLFLTHAAKTATEVENLILGMAPEHAIHYLAADPPELVVTTLWSLANRQMRYDLDGLTPVSLDGHDGREFQADLLNGVIDAYLTEDWIAYRSACSEPFINYMQSPSDSNVRRFFLWELLNEFACVLDAEGVKGQSELREKYLGEKRKTWMMLLETREERQVVLDLYDRFRAELRSLKAIGGDQMVTDFLNLLDSFRWEATREQEGYDAVFVDELHLFNRQERMVFRHLLRTTEGNPAVFVAYDAKQSPRDTFLNLPSADAKQLDFWRDAKLGKAEKIELIDVFRYTPQIAKTLSCIDDEFPGQDLDDDWPKYSGISRLGDGPLPTLCTLPSTVATYTLVFNHAKAIQRSLGKAGRVAVLCASNELFGRYLKFTELRDSFYAITSRDEASSINANARRFLFSMPEYVAGMQFDTVLLIDVNQGEVPQGPYAAAALRKFAAQVYLGASRAERRLEIYASKQQGGAASLISKAVFAKAVEPLPDGAMPAV